MWLPIIAAVGAVLLVGGIEVRADPAINPAVTQETIGETICAPGYAAKVRPPWYILARFKFKLLTQRGESWRDARKYQLDHIISLCLGGAPRDLSNLQLQTWEEAKEKDHVKIQACRCVSNGMVTLAEAQRDLATDWRAAFQKYERCQMRGHLGARTSTFEPGEYTHDHGDFTQ